MIDINKKIMESMKAHDKVASETFKLLKAKILEFKTAKNAKEYTETKPLILVSRLQKKRGTFDEKVIEFTACAAHGHVHDARGLRRR